jgi:uncharacterized protein (TIGR02996 family)
MKSIPSASELLAVWRQTREPRVADVLAALARVAPPLKAPSPKVAHAKKWIAWTKRLDDDEVAGLCRAFESAASTSHLPAFDRFDPDPRIGTLAVRMLARFRGFDRSNQRQLHERFFELVAHHADANIVAQLGRLARVRYGNTGYINTTPWFDTRIAEVLARLRETVPASTADDALRARCTAWIDAIRRPPVTTLRERLFADVYAAPDDDGPRAVLADHLQQVGDPQGELIALQLAGVSDRRANALAVRYGRKLVHAAIWGMMVGKTVRFERGFPAFGRVWPRRAHYVRDAVGAVEWATFHTLDLGSFAGWNTSYAEREWILELVSDPAMRWLRKVGPLRVAEVSALVDHGVAMPWRDITIEKSAVREYESTLVDDLASNAWLFPALRRLTLDLSESSLEQLAERAAWLSCLDQLTTVGEPTPAAKRLAAVLGAELGHSE